MARLERLLSSVWDPAMTGDLRAVAMALRIVQAECKLMGLNEPSKRSQDESREWPCCQGRAMLVVRPDDCRWVGCERHGRFER